MTRINCIPVEELADQHLMAEYRELPMINASLRRSLLSKSQAGMKTIPAEYTLNAGHVKFFYNKGLFLRNRYEELIAELKRRKYNVNPAERSVDWSVFCMYDKSLNANWVPKLRDQRINVERLILRLEDKVSWYKHHRKPIDNEFVRNMKEKYIGLPVN